VVVPVLEKARLKIGFLPQLRAREDNVPQAEAREVLEDPRGLDGPGKAQEEAQGGEGKRLPGRAILGLEVEDQPSRSSFRMRAIPRLAGAGPKTESVTRPAATVSPTPFLRMRRRCSWRRSEGGMSLPASPASRRSKFTPERLARPG